MPQSAMGYGGCISAPHRAAALSGQAVLSEGGTSIEAMVAAAATIAVVYPHMNGVGGDAFWLIKRKGEKPVAIAGAGRAARLATVERYRAHGYSEIPSRGAGAALLVPGALATWQLALDLVPQEQRLSLRRLLADAVNHAGDGFAISASLAETIAAKASELSTCPGFADIYLPGGRPPETGQPLTQPALRRTLETLAANGLDSFYRGRLAETHVSFLEHAGSPLRLEDFGAYRAEYVEPLSTAISAATLFNLPPPTQGIASLMILAIFDRLGVTSADGFAHIHGLVEATKQAFLARNRHLGDPDAMTIPAASLIAPDHLAALAAEIDTERARPWPEPSLLGGTIWMGAADRFGTIVSFIQSVFWEFGSGLTCPETGVVFQNRGAGFSLAPGPNQLAPGKRPLHTLNPALAELSDGRVIAYGTMGGDGQPQTQAAVFTRYALFGRSLEEAITAPRWLLGKTWGDTSTSLKLESRMSSDIVSALRAAGHRVEVVEEFSQTMGHAGAVVMHPSGLLEGASDPRSDGSVERS
jgi:gamma-glutamyltranspeptidase/glutathione hydrolase